MNTNPNTGSNSTRRREAHYLTLKSIGWKLLIVAVAVLAYSGQKVLERTKKQYDAEQSRALVIVDDNDPKLTTKEDFIKLPLGPIQTLLTESKQQAVSARELKDTPLKELVHRIKYQNLKDEKEIIDRLNAEVLVESDLKKRAYLDTRDALNKNRAAKLTPLADERTLVYNRLEQVVSTSANEKGELPKPEEVQAAIAKLINDNQFNETQTVESKQAGGSKAATPVSKSRRQATKSPAVAAVAGTEQKLSTATKEELARWLNKLDKQTADEQNIEVARQWIAKADGVAQGQIKIIHEQLRPKLGEIIGAAKTQQGFTTSDSKVLTFFDPRSIFNEKSGSYVIYQTIYLICIGVMVFFVVFICFALLRPLPFFGGRAETLGAQLDRLLNRPGAAEGAAPQLARSLVVSAAALGVGTAAAVAVAGDRAINRPALRGGDGPVIASAYHPDEEGPYPTGKRWSDPARTTPLKVELTPQIVYPQPTVIEHTTNTTTGTPPFDTTLITRLQDRVIDLSNSNTTLTDTVARLQPQVKKVDEIEQSVAGLTKQVGGVQVVKLESQVGEVAQRATSNELNVVNLKGRVGQMETLVSAGLNTITKDLSVTKEAVSDLRYNSFERTQNSGGRNFFTRTNQQLFGGENFMVTHQSYKALEDLMCRGGCNDPDKTAILTALGRLTGQPPIGKSKFIENFASVSPNVLKLWKPLLLKYTRVSY